MTSRRASFLSTSPTALATLALAAFTALGATAPGALAQTPPPTAAAAPTAQQPGGDPPSRVARLDYLSGPVTTEPAGASDWSYAAVNRPLTTGDQLWNDRGGRSEMHIGSTAVRLDQSTSLALLNLDDSNAQLKVALGTLSTHVREVPPGSAYEIDTPNLALAINGAGDYRVDVAPDGASTTVTVRSGSATVYGDSGQMPIGPGQQVTFTGTGLQTAGSGAAPAPDAFDQWGGARDAAEDRSISARYVSREIPGYQDLDANGSWHETPEYGAVWTPNSVPAGWAPYHTGHWIWQAPWGWTWVDDAPWGFAPYHYGRWAYVDNSWGWVPGPIVPAAPPCYAPALVAFVGGGGGGFDWSVGLAAGGALAAGIAWFPLGPREVWHPGWQGWSPRYYERVNRPVFVNQTVNITNIHNTYVNYHVRNAITAVPATAFMHGQPVTHFAQHVDPQQWRNARIGAGAPGIAPVRQSFSGGLRNAAYRPPQAAFAHPIVATRNPAVPAAFHDRQAQQYAQHGGSVPGAGAPVIRAATPPNYAARPVRPVAGGAAPNGGRNPWAMHNVQLVNPHGPVLQPGRGGPAAHPGPGTPPAAAMRGNGMPAAGFARPGAPTPGNGVPRPPAESRQPGGAQPPGQAAPGDQPAWTRPHAPIAQQHANGGFPHNDAAGQRGGEASGGQPHPNFGERYGQNVQNVQSRVNGVPVQPGGQGFAPNQTPHAAPGMHVPTQPRVEQQAPHVNAPRPEFGQQQPPHMAAPQPHVEAPRFERPQPQPRVEAPRMEAPQPHFERPQPQPQPRMEPQRMESQHMAPQHVEAPRPAPAQPHPQEAPHPGHPAHG
ncbi:FecR protein [Burkholderia plantarii]|uniref:DUF6600 domain-containing protein n=1 Tax=Burkholderia plantarii TaxID=41899 RepID=UPI00272D9032|nr:DUF6600 domain-containing protein [Burkholderia plantarii]WLE58491.1 FecR protein [Burkholderia plantarii]